jgi:hypothetical protein
VDPLEDEISTIRAGPVGIEVSTQLRGDEGRKRNHAGTDPRFGSVDGDGTSDAIEATIHRDARLAGSQVEVGNAQSRNLAGAQAGEASDEHEGSVPPGHRLGQPTDLLSGEDRPLRRTGVSAA